VTGRGAGLGAARVKTDSEAKATVANDSTELTMLAETTEIEYGCETMVKCPEEAKENKTWDQKTFIYAK
jgi:hypothetical protein